MLRGRDGRVGEGVGALRGRRVACTFCTAGFWKSSAMVHRTPELLSPHVAGGTSTPAEYTTKTIEKMSCGMPTVNEYLPAYARARLGWNVGM